MNGDGEPKRNGIVFCLEFAKKGPKCNRDKQMRSKSHCIEEIDDKRPFSIILGW
jgi:hypothetical protein